MEDCGCNEHVRPLASNSRLHISMLALPVSYTNPRNTPRTHLDASATLRDIGTSVLWTVNAFVWRQTESGIDVDIGS